MRRLDRDPFLSRLVTALILYAAMVTVWMHSAPSPGVATSARGVR